MSSECDLYRFSLKQEAKANFESGANCLMTSLIATPFLSFIVENPPEAVAGPIGYGVLMSLLLSYPSYGLISLARGVQLNSKAAYLEANDTPPQSPTSWYISNTRCVLDAASLARTICLNSVARPTL